MENVFLTARSSPHIRARVSTKNIMLDVCIALLPVSLVGIYQFGWYVLAILATSVAAAILTEFLYTKLLKKEMTITDGSAAVTGLLLALTLPSTVPLWIPVIGSVFAILIVKCMFGGIGQNFVNPALAARAMLMASWPALLTTFPSPRDPQTSILPWLANRAHDIGVDLADITAVGTKVVSAATSANVVDAASVATPLSGLQNNFIGWPGNGTDFMVKFLGYSSGVIGEVSVLAILIGAAYLFIRRVIRPTAPLAFVLSFAFFAWMWIGMTDSLFSGNVLGELMFGGVLFAAFFMITDYSTSPMTKAGQIIFGAGAGFLTVVIRHFGSYPEGVTYAILLMNLCVPLLDRILVPRAFGGKKAKHG